MTEKQDIAVVLAQNIADRRKRSGMTQAELAEKLGYSDKSISKWERGEGMPDVLCLKRMADLFGVTVDAFLTPYDAEDGESTDPVQISLTTGEGTEEKREVNHWAIAAVAICGAWLVALVVFLIGSFCGKDFSVALAAGIPATTLLAVIFNGLWGSAKRTFWLSSLFAAGVLFFLCWIFRQYQIWWLMSVTLPIAGVIWFGCRIRKN